MTEFFKFITTIVGFRFWTNNVKHFTLSTAPKKSSELNKDFEGGLQKALVLSALIYACNITFKKVAPASFVTSQYLELFLPLIISGFAVYFLSFLLLSVVVKNLEIARHYTNIVIIQMVVSLSIMLLLTFAGITTWAYARVFPALATIHNCVFGDQQSTYRDGLVSIYFWASFPVVFSCAALATLVCYLNTKGSDRTGRGLRATMYTLYAAIVLNCYLFAPMTPVTP